MYISMYDKRVYIHTERHIEEVKWDCKKQRVKLKFPEDAQVLNPILTGLEDLVWKVYNSSRVESIEQMKEMLMKEMQKEVKQMKEEQVQEQEQDKSFFSYYEDFLKDSKSRINGAKVEKLSLGTLNQYTSAKETLVNFEKHMQKEDEKYVLTFDMINSKFYSDFRYYCLEEVDLSPNTFGGKIKKLKTFLFWCQNRGIQVGNNFVTFEIPQSYKDAQPLTGEELKDLWNKDLGADQWRLDVFLALCSSGMRISDYNEVMTDMNRFLRKSKEGEALVFNAQKTGARCTVPIYNDDCFRLKYLYDKYNGKMPRLSGQNLNEWLKESGLIKRIEVKSKTGRKTLCSVKYFELGMEAQYIMPITGHTTESEFKKYLGVSPNTIIKANKEKSSYTLL